MSDVVVSLYDDKGNRLYVGVVEESPGPFVAQVTLTGSYPRVDVVVSGLVERLNEHGKVWAAEVSDLENSVAELEAVRNDLLAQAVELEAELEVEPLEEDEE